MKVTGETAKKVANHPPEIVSEKATQRHLDPRPTPMHEGRVQIQTLQNAGTL